MFNSCLTQITKVAIIAAFILPGLAIPTVAETSLPTMTNAIKTETLSNQTQVSRQDVYCRMIGFGCWW